MLYLNLSNSRGTENDLWPLAIAPCGHWLDLAGYGQFRIMNPILFRKINERRENVQREQMTGCIISKMLKNCSAE